MISIYDISGNKIENSEVLKNLLITKSCQHIEELMKSNYIQLSWDDVQKYQLPVGAYIIPFPDEYNHYAGGDSRYPIKYRLFEPYIPESSHETQYKYEPQFQHPIMWLDKLPLMLITGDISEWDDAVKKTTWGYTGSPQQIAMKIVDCINWLATHYQSFGDVVGGGWTAFVDTDLTPSISVTFDSTSIMSGAAQIANACDCEYHFDFDRKQLRLGTIRYGTEITLTTGINVGVASVSRTKKDYHNSFIIKGSTKNLSQTTDGGENVQITERLTLDPTEYPDSTMYTDDEGNILTRDQFMTLGVPSLMEELIFDDIYPKLELYVYNVRERKCWLLDEDGNKVEDSDGVEDTDGKKYKAYSKWYLRLAYPIYTTDSEGNRTVSRWVDYTLSDSNLIEGQTAQITFLANMEDGALNSLMLGQGDFDVVYFDKETHEKEDDDMDASGFTAKVGDYRIVFNESGSVIIPTTSSGGIYPQGDATPKLTNNKATLINVVVDDAYKEQARLDLEMVAKRKVALLRSDLNNYELPSDPVYFEKNDPLIHLGQAVVYNDGQTLNGTTPYSLITHIIKIVTQLDYPFVRDITVGNEKVKGDISTLKEQVSTIMTGTGGSGGGITEEQVNTLINSYGSKYFLSKTHDDTAQGKITFEQESIHKEGAQFGESFIPGLVGIGGQIDGKGNGELRSLKLWEWLEVPELRYNRVSIYTGIRWDTFGGGIIESITPDADGSETGTGTLKLEAGEIGAIAVGDLCMGIWHDEREYKTDDGTLVDTDDSYTTTENETEDSDDNKGNFTFAGFKTVYFQITAVSGSDNGTFSYLLRSSLDGGNHIHPFAGMHFAGRGNISDTSRQAFTYTTTRYSLALVNVSTWEFQSENYIEIRGNLEGFSMPAVNASGNPYTKVFHGYGQVFGNAYIYGQIDQFERVGYRMTIDQSLNGSLAPGETETVTCTVYNGYGSDVTSQFTLYSVTRNSGDAASDAVWNAAHTNVGNPFSISFSDLGIDGINKLVTVFTVTATDESSDETASQSIDFNS